MSRVCIALLVAMATPAWADSACEQGTAFAKAGDVTRALLYLERCTDDDAAAKLARDLKKRARETDFAELSVVSDPAGVTFSLDTLPGETLTTPTTVFVKPGTHVVTYQVGERTFTKPAQTIAYSRSALILDAVVKPASAPKDGTVSFEEENATEQQTGPPPDIKRPSLMKDKYRGVSGPAGTLEDPFAVRVSSRRSPWFGLRLGGGVFDDAATAAAMRPSVAATVRIPLLPRGFIAGRVDYSRRGGSSSDSVDALGMNLGAGYTALATRSLAAALIVQLRGELRFAETRDAMAVAQSGAGFAAGVEVALRGVPLTVGARAETAITELVPGARDRAFLVELGVDWR